MGIMEPGWGMEMKFGVIFAIIAAVYSALFILEVISYEFALYVMIALGFLMIIHRAFIC